MSSAVDSSAAGLSGVSASLPKRLGTDAPNGFLGIPWSTWLKVAVIAAAFVVLYHFNLVRLWNKTNPIWGEENWHHAMCIPAIGLYYLFLRRDELAKTPVEPLLGGLFTRTRLISGLIVIAAGLFMAFVGYRFIPEGGSMSLVRGIAQNGGHAMWAFGLLVLAVDWGLACLLGGLVVSAYGIYPGRNDFVWDFGMILTLFGVVLTMCGWRVMRIAWFPIVFLVCALPWPQLVYSQVASPLQALAARVSVGVLQVGGIDANYAGTKIFMAQFDSNGLPAPDRVLNVAEACAGLKSLMSFISIAAAIAFLSARPMWQKLIITFSAIPIAIFCNVMRVAGQGLLDHYVGREWSEEFAHRFVGTIMMLPAFLLILLVCWIVDHLFIEEGPETSPAASKSPEQPKPAGGAA